MTGRRIRSTRWKSLVRTEEAPTKSAGSLFAYEPALMARFPTIYCCTAAELIRHLNDPEHPLTLEQLNVTSLDGVVVDDENSTGTSRILVSGLHSACYMKRAHSAPRQAGVKSTLLVVLCRLCSGRALHAHHPPLLHGHADRPVHPGQAAEGPAAAVQGTGVHHAR